jgi:hypothetical protein
VTWNHLLPATPRQQWAKSFWGGRGFTAWFARRAEELHPRNACQYGQFAKGPVSQLIAAVQVSLRPAESPWREWWDALMATHDIPILDPEFRDAARLLALNLWVRGF